MQKNKARASFGEFTHINNLNKFQGSSLKERLITNQRFSHPNALAIAQLGFDKNAHKEIATLCHKNSACKSRRQLCFKEQVDDIAAGLQGWVRESLTRQQKLRKDLQRFKTSEIKIKPIIDSREKVKKRKKKRRWLFFDKNDEPPQGKGLMGEDDLWMKDLGMMFDGVEEYDLKRKRKVSLNGQNILQNDDQSKRESVDDEPIDEKQLNQQQEIDQYFSRPETKAIQEMVKQYDRCRTGRLFMSLNQSPQKRRNQNIVNYTTRQCLNLERKILVRLNQSKNPYFAEMKKLCEEIRTNKQKYKTYAQFFGQHSQQLNSHLCAQQKCPPSSRTKLKVDSSKVKEENNHYSTDIPTLFLNKIEGVTQQQKSNGFNITHRAFPNKKNTYVVSSHGYRSHRLSARGKSSLVNYFRGQSGKICEKVTQMQRKRTKLKTGDRVSGGRLHQKQNCMQVARYNKIIRYF